MIKEKAKIRSVVMRTWYKQQIVRLVIDFPLEEMDKNVYPVLSKYIGKTVFVQIQEHPFNQKKISEWSEKNE